MPGVATFVRAWSQSSACSSHRNRLTVLASNARIMASHLFTTSSSMHCSDTTKMLRPIGACSRSLSLTNYACTPTPPPPRLLLRPALRVRGHRMLGCSTRAATSVADTGMFVLGVQQGERSHIPPTTTTHMHHVCPSYTDAATRVNLPKSFEPTTSEQRIYEWCVFWVGGGVVCVCGGGCYV